MKIQDLSGLSLKLNRGSMYILDQTLLPNEEKWHHVDSPEDLYEHIKYLRVRGAPLIGISAGLCLGLYALTGKSKEQYIKACEYLRGSRPTAVNLMFVVDRLVQQAKDHFNAEFLMQMSIDFFNEDIQLCDSIASHGAEFIQSGDSILTHCNTGALATAGIGTALGVIKKAHQDGKKIHVFVNETRPLLQGGRLTTYELEKASIPYTLICDSMAAQLISRGKIKKVIVGADRIAVNGDFANKIGTYAVALASHYHKVPFYVAAPHTTVDASCRDGSQIEIEQRHPDEVRGVSGSFGKVIWAPNQCQVYNPAFDVTPNEFVTAWILDQGSYQQANFT